MGHNGGLQCHQRLLLVQGLLHFLAEGHKVAAGQTTQHGFKAWEFFSELNRTRQDYISLQLWKKK